MSWLAKIFLSKETRAKIQKELEEAGGYDAWVEKNEKELNEELEKLDQKRDEYVEHNQKVRKKAEDYSKALGVLERQIQKHLFTEAEILEITKEKIYATEIAERATKTTDEHAELMWKQTKLAGSLRNRNDELRALEKEDDELRKKVIAYGEEVFACYAAIEKWIELGKQREASGGLPKATSVPQSSQPVQSVADELSKLKALLDDGVLTQEEFDHKKKILLGM